MARIGLLAFALIVISCDPVNKITIQFHVQPTSTVTAYWVHKYQGRTYAQGQVFHGEVAADPFAVTRSECCGNAAAYRDHELWFIACVAQSGADPTLVCGLPQDPEAKLVRRTAPGTTCDALDTTIERGTIDLATCTVSAPPTQ